MKNFKTPIFLFSLLCLLLIAGTQSYYSEVSIVDRQNDTLNIQHGGMDVNMQDQTTLAINGLMSDAISTFTLSSDISSSTSESLVLSFEATAGHGLIAGDEIFLIETSLERTLYAEVILVSINTITIDRPIDVDFAAATTLGRKVETNMAVDGSSAPRFFTVRAGAQESDFYELVITATNTVDSDYSKFFGETALANGISFRIYDSFQETIYNFKSDGDMGLYGEFESIAKSPAGAYGFKATFCIRQKNGVALRIGENDIIQIAILDDLTGLTSMHALIKGHKTN